MNDKLREALEADGCERIKDFYNVGPVQRAAVESFVAALTATQQAAPSQVGGREMQTPVAWVVRFNDPDPQIDIEFTQECPAGWVGRAEPLYEGPTVRNIELLHRAQRAEAQLAAILEASTQREQPAASKQEPQAQAEPEEIQRLEAHCIAYREAIVKKDAALDVCMAALRTYDLIDTQAAAAITQAKEARK